MQQMNLCLNKKNNLYTYPFQISIEETYKETEPYMSFLNLISKGSNPTSQIEGYCSLLKKPNTNINSIREVQKVKT